MSLLTIIFYPNAPLSDSDIKILRDEYIENFDFGKNFELEFGNFGGNMKTKIGFDEDEVERRLNHISAMFDLKILGSLISPENRMTMYNISGFPRILVSLKISHPKKLPAEIPEILERTVSIVRTENLTDKTLLFSGIIVGAFEHRNPSSYVETILFALEDFSVNVCGSVWVEGENCVANFDYMPWK